MRGNRRRLSAQGLVEFALVGPIFFMTVFGIIEGGRLVWTVHTLNNATNEGVRYAIVRGADSELSDAPATQANVKAQMLSKSSGLNSGALSVSLTYPDGNNESKSRVRVESDYTYQLIVQMVFGSGTMNLEASAEGIISR
jgi:Flp pilus assembly protein TadG